jgi:uncharacterized protein (TIGR00369 family)
MTATALDTLPAPPCAVLLGWKILDAKPEQGWIRVGFEGKPEFRNPAGYIQGGILAAMLDDTMGPAAFIMGKGEVFTPTIDMNVSFLAPAKVGPIVGEARVVQMGKTIAFLEGKLTDESGTLLARATASVRVVPSAKALG